MSTLAEHPTTRFARRVDAVADLPAERRGLARDAVRLLVAGDDGVSHTRFRDLPDHLGAGDLVVVNDSATLAAQVEATSASRGPVVVHLAAPLEARQWVVEVRSSPDAARALLDLEPGERLQLGAGPGAVRLTLSAPYPHEGSSPTGVGSRLWRARAEGDLARHARLAGRPIAYGYLAGRQPLSAYQSIFSTRPGSAEMPSAGRAFTPEVVTALVSRGVAVVPITLHTGVSSQEAGEGPQPERFEVPAGTARLVEAVRAGGGRIVAVGTTVTRALESALDAQGRVVATRGWTERVVTPRDPPRVVTGLVTGWHDPEASHLLLVEAVAGAALTQAAYDAASSEGYLWHEFGDVGLLLPPLR